MRTAAAVLVRARNVVRGSNNRIPFGGTTSMGNAAEFAGPAGTASVPGGSVSFRHAGRRAATLGSMCLMLTAMLVASGVGLLTASTVEASGPPPGAEFQVTSFVTEVKDRDGLDETKAGAHP